MKSEQLHKRLSLVVAPLAFGVLGACGGSGSGIGVADGGIRGTGSSVGPVSGFGSVFVNGVEFSTDSIVNGEVQGNDGIFCEQKQYCTASLEKGMILRVEGQWNPDGTGTAEALEYDDTFRGTVTAVDVTQSDSAGFPQAGTLTLLGQTISFDRRTVIQLDSGYTDASVLDGKQVRISAWPSESGYRASYIGELDTLPDGWVEVEGLARYELSDSLFIGAQQIVVPADSVFTNGLTPDALANQALRIEVEGEFNGVAVVARTIRPADDRRYIGAEGEDIEITGTVSGYSSVSASFFVTGVAVNVTPDTEFDDLDRNQLKDDMLVRVEGEFRNGAIVAEEIELFEGDAEVEANVLSAAPLTNELNVGGVRVRLTNNTLIESDDESSGSVYDAEFLEIEGIERRDANDQVYLEALNIEFESEGTSEFELKGRLPDGDYSYASGTLIVLGVEMSYNENFTEVDDDADWRDCSIVSVDYNTFYQALKIGCEDDD